MNLRYAFQDDENCFFVLDLMLGGDLRCEFAGWLVRDRLVLMVMWWMRAWETVHLERQGAMSEEIVRFYVCEIALAVDFLHSKRIVHR